MNFEWKEELDAQTSGRAITTFPGMVAQLDTTVADSNKVLKEAKHEQKKAHAKAFITARKGVKSADEAKAQADIDEGYDQATAEVILKEYDYEKAIIARDEVKDKLATARQIYKKWYGADQGS